VKMRLSLVLALLFLVALVSASRPARRNGAQRSGSRGTSCKGSSGGRGCRPRTTSQTTQSRPTSISNSSTRRPSTRLPTKRTTTQSTTSSTRRPRIPTKRTTTTKRRFPTKKPPNSASTVDEESISDSSTKNKTSAKKYFQNLKTKFKTAAIWFVENKDKSLDEILVERWKEKCSGTDSKKEKRKRCVSAALAEREDDTPEEKLVKDALKRLLEEDSDEIYEFLNRSSSRTFRDIENEGETQDDQTPEGNRSCRRKRGILRPGSDGCSKNTETYKNAEREALSVLNGKTDMKLGYHGDLKKLMKDKTKWTAAMNSLKIREMDLVLKNLENAVKGAEGANHDFGGEEKGHQERIDVYGRAIAALKVIKNSRDAAAAEAARLERDAKSQARAEAQERDSRAPGAPKPTGWSTVSEVDKRFEKIIDREDSFHI